MIPPYDKFNFNQSELMLWNDGFIKIKGNIKDAAYALFQAFIVRLKYNNLLKSKYKYKRIYFNCLNIDVNYPHNIEFEPTLINEKGEYSKLEECIKLEEFNQLKLHFNKFIETIIPLM